jgi:hypothetical protein
MLDEAWRSERELASLDHDELVELTGLRRSDLYVMGRALVLRGRWSAARSAFRQAVVDAGSSRLSLAWSLLSARVANIPASTERSLAPPEVDPVEREAGESLPVAASLALAAARLPSSRQRLLARCDALLSEVLDQIPDHPQALEVQAATS